MRPPSWISQRWAAVNGLKEAERHRRVPPVFDSPAGARRRNARRGSAWGSSPASTSNTFFISRDWRDVTGLFEPMQTFPAPGRARAAPPEERWRTVDSCPGTGGRIPGPGGMVKRTGLPVYQQAGEACQYLQWRRGVVASQGGFSGPTCLIREAGPVLVLKAIPRHFSTEIRTHRGDQTPRHRRVARPPNSQPVQGYRGSLRRWSPYPIRLVVPHTDRQLPPPSSVSVPHVCSEGHFAVDCGPPQGPRSTELSAGMDVVSRRHAGIQLSHLGSPAGHRRCRGLRRYRESALAA